MSDTHDKESRTEEATEKRINDAIEKGNVPFSRETVTFGSIAGILLSLKISAAWSTVSLAGQLRTLLSHAADLKLDSRQDLNPLLVQLAKAAGQSLLAPLALIAGLAACAAIAQNMPQFATDRIAPKFSRLSPSNGLQRLFSKQAFAEFARAVIKIMAVTIVTVVILRQRFADIQNVIAMDPGDVPALILDMAIAMFSTVAGVSLVFAAADFVWSRRRWRRDLRMTRQEVREEHRQQEGDQTLKMRIRTAARQRISRRMMTRLPSATLVVTNPTHYAIALRYVREDGGAPVVIAKGLDHLALRIRERAADLGIPMVENRPLAHALYDTVEIDQEIPAVLYKAVAEIIHFLQVRKLYPSSAPGDKRQPGTRLHG